MHTATHGFTGQRPGLPAGRPHNEGLETGSGGGLHAKLRHLER